MDRVKDTTDCPEYRSSMSENPIGSVLRNMRLRAQPLTAGTCQVTRSREMADKRRFVYQNGKLAGAVTTKKRSDGSVEVIRQRARSGLFGPYATSITSRTKYK